MKFSTGEKRCQVLSAFCRNVCTLEVTKIICHVHFLKDSSLRGWRCLVSIQNSACACNALPLRSSSQAHGHSHSPRSQPIFVWWRCARFFCVPPPAPPTAFDGSKKGWRGACVADSPAFGLLAFPADVNCVDGLPAVADSSSSSPGLAGCPPYQSAPCR